MCAHPQVNKIGNVDKKPSALRVMIVYSSERERRIILLFWIWSIQYTFHLKKVSGLFKTDIFCLWSVLSKQPFLQLLHYFYTTVISDDLISVMHYGTYIALLNIKNRKLCTFPHKQQIHLYHHARKFQWSSLPEGISVPIPQRCTFNWD